MIGDDIEILISDVTDNKKVDLAIDAPKSYAIKRKDLHIKEQKFGPSIGNQSRQRHKRD